MRNAILTAATVAAILVSGGAMAGVPVNPITQQPGNSSAAQDALPNGQPDCFGDLISTARQTNRGDQHPGPGQHLNPNIIGAVFTLGSVIGVIAPGETCSEFVQP